MSETHITVTPAERSFTRKQIVVTFNIVNLDGSTDSLTLSGEHRIRASITHAGMSAGSELTLVVEGMTYHDMNRLSFIENRPNTTNPTLKNQSDTTVTVRAGTYGKALPTIFHGNVCLSRASYNDGSQTFFMKAQTFAVLASVIPPAFSYSGPRNVVSILSDICIRCGYTLVNHGGWGSFSTLINHYGEGTSLDMIREVIQHVGATFNFIPNDSANTTAGASTKGALHVWGPNYDGTRNQQEDTLPLISPETGLIGYPEYSAIGLTFTSQFRQDIAFYSPIIIKSSQIPAGWLSNSQGYNQQHQSISWRNAPWNGTWQPMHVTHDLSAEIPGGPWFTTAECQRTDLSNPYVTPKS